MASTEVAAPSYPALETLKFIPHEADVVEVTLHRPDRSNAMSRRMWAEIGDAFRFLARVDLPVRAILLTGSGRNFTSGLDMADHVNAFTEGAAGEGGEGPDASRRGFRMLTMIRLYQDALMAIEKCSKPVIAAVHGACIGGGVDMIAAADIRLASADAWFSIKEAEIGITADVGTLQRLPKIMGNDSIVREWALTARRFTAEEAAKHGLLSRVLRDKDELHAHALAMARQIASLSPIAVQGTKVNLNYSRDRSVADGLEFAAAWNMGMLQTPDISIAATSSMTKTPAVYPRL